MFLFDPKHSIAFEQWSICSDQHSKSIESELGTVATCCKPSSRAGVVWANGAWVIGLGQARSLEKGPPLRGVPMHTFHHSATTPGRWICQKNEAKRVACGAQGREFDSLRGRHHFRLQSCYNVMPILCLLCNNHCKKVAFYLIGNCSGLFSSEIKASRQILKKSIESVKGNLPRGSHQHWTKMAWVRTLVLWKIFPVLNLLVSLAWTYDI